MQQSRLVLESGEIFVGQSPKWQQGCFFGEVVFTTGMVGYVESLTDPSFAGQILTFTYPLIGNYGVPDRSLWESSKIQVSGVVLANGPVPYEHHQAVRSLQAWLDKERIPLIVDVDTRALTQRLRIDGVALGAICHGKRPKRFPELTDTSLVELVTIKEPQIYGTGRKKIIAVDCGMKENILRSLLQYPVTIKRVPAGYDYTNERWDGLFISNGPGDPVQCQKTVEILRHALEKKKPIFGICLGAQLLSLAIGAKTYKLPYGHRGQNHPCISEGKCYLTSQNHGFAIDEKTLPPGWKVSFRSLNDHSVEGIEHETLPFSAVQFHPEAAPGPTDTQWLFERFCHAL